jgi:hypothetical protein
MLKQKFLGRATGAMMMLALTFVVSDCRAGLILQPVSATAQLPMGEYGAAYADDFLVDQSGLSVGYSTGDDLDAYLASNPIGSNGAGTWASTAGNPTGNMDFDLGGSFNVAEMVLWNFAPNSIYNILGFDLLADDNSAFSARRLSGPSVQIRTLDRLRRFSRSPQLRQPSSG